MITEEFLTLPPWIEYEGISFELQLFVNKTTEARLCYAIRYVTADSPHKADIDSHGSWYNKLEDPGNPPLQGFLLLYEGIENDVDLLFAIRSCWHRLWELGLMTENES